MIQEKSIIKLFDPVISEASIELVTSVLRSGWIGLGPVTEQFEREFALYVGSKYAVGVNSATSALHLAVKVCDLRPGDEVITTPITFISTNHVLLYENLVPVFCDVDEETLNIDLDKIPALITEKTKAIMAVHYAGNPIDLDKLYATANAYGLKVIEDAAHACGSVYRGRKIGSFGLTCFSFHAVKNLAAGDGGMVTTDDDQIYSRLQNLRWMGIDKSTFDRTSTHNYNWDYQVKEVGFKYYLNDITAAIALGNLRELDRSNSLRHYMASCYAGRLGAGVKALSITKGAISSNHLFVVKVPNRNELHKTLAAAGINSGVHYRPNHLYPMYSKYARHLPVAVQAYKEIISLPMHVKLTETDIALVCDNVNRHVVKEG